jgi:transcriptional regulator with XRE-family HTH domain
MSSMSRNATTQEHPHFAKFLLAVAIEPKEIGRRIKTARNRKGWTQLQFAYEANVSPSSVQRWEGGQLPPVRELMRVADVLGVSADEFVEPEVSQDEDRLRTIVQEEVSELQAQLGRILELLQEPSQSRREKP